MSDPADPLPPFDKASAPVIAYVDYSIGVILVLFSFFLLTNGADRPVANAAVGVTILFVANAIVRRLLLRRGRR